MIFIWLSKYIFQYVYKLEMNNLWSKLTRMYVSCECGSFPDRILCRCGLYEIRTLSDHTLALLIYVHVPDRLTNMPVWTYMYIAKDNFMMWNTRITVQSTICAYKGAASWAFQAGLPGEVIQIMGDWQSDAYKLYLEIQPETKYKFSQKFGACLPYS